MSIYSKKIENMTTNYEYLLVNLKVLSKIEENGRISTKNSSSLGLEHPSMFQWLYRTFTGDSRVSAISDISALVNRTIDYTEDLLLFINDVQINKKEPNMYDRERFEKYKHQLERIRTELAKCINGIERLKITYRTDVTTVSRLEVVIDSALSHVSKIENILANVAKFEEEGRKKENDEHE